ncbi:MAG: ATP-binding protein, partial [Saprospiraceae bacterium]
FPVIRALIDRNRRPGRYIILGSASPELIRDTSESLAGRVAYLELAPFNWQEVQNVVDYRAHWLRGGFPESLLAASDALSFEWRLNFIQSYLERDLPLLGLNADPMLIRRLWMMTAHLNGNLLNMGMLAGSLGISNPTVRRYLDFLESAYLIRRLHPYHFNIKKRLVKTPKIYIRDTGILHSLLNIGDMQQLLGHPALGGSWEAYIIQEIATRIPPHTELFFYRTQDGTEADLVIAPGGIPKILVEIKFTSTPKVSKGFHIAKTDLKTERNFIVCPVDTGYPLSEDTSVLSHLELDHLLR